MTNVTVPGANNSVVTLTYDRDANATLALHVAAAITAGMANNTIIAADSKFGPPPPLPAGKIGEFVQSTTGVSMMPTNYNYVVNAASTAVIFGSGSPDESILTGAGNLTFFATSGSGSVIGGGGNNLISIAPSDTGSWLIALGDGNNSVRAFGSGNDTISTGAGHNIIQTGTGNDFITTAGSDTILASTGSETITASGSDVVYGNGSRLLFVGMGDGGTTVYGGTGSDSVFGAGGPNLLFGGSAGNNFLQAGGGPATLFGGGDGDQLYAGGDAAQALHAASGNETLFGGFASGNDTFYGGSGSDQIFGGSGNNTFVAGSGAATVAAVGSHNVFEFIQGQAGGAELVQFLTDSSQVHIVLSGYGATEASDAVAGQTHSGGATTITLSDNTKVTFQNVGSLTTGNFS